MTTVEFQCSQVVRGDVKIHFYHQTVETVLEISKNFLINELY